MNIEKIIEAKVREFRFGDNKKLVEWILALITNPEVEIGKVKVEMLEKKTKSLASMDSQKATLTAEVSQLSKVNVSTMMTELATPKIIK